MDEDSFIGELIQVTREILSSSGVGVSHDVKLQTFGLRDAVTDANTNIYALTMDKYPKDCSVELAELLLPNPRR